MVAIHKKQTAGRKSLKNKQTEMNAQAKVASVQANLIADADTILQSVIGFFLASGISQEALTKVISESIRKCVARGNPPNVGPMRALEAYMDVVKAWTTSSNYLDKDGAPKILKIEGKHGFRALLKSVDRKLKLEEAIKDLKTYGNIRRMRDGRLKLLKEFLHVSSSKFVAYEPQAKFLSRACKSNSSLFYPGAIKGEPENYWRFADGGSLSAESLAEFIAFSKVRSMVFLRELDEWLRVNAQESLGDSPKYKAGLSLFSYYEED